MKKRRQAIPTSNSGKLRTFDHELWERVASTVTPLIPLQHKKYHGSVQTSASPGAVGRLKPCRPAKTESVKMAASLPSPATIKPGGGLDRRLQQKMSRGNMDIDARLDLHGHSVEQARGALRSFLYKSRERGSRNVLVITGKGDSPFTRHTLHATDVFHAPERKGRLRVELTRWMQEREFLDQVVGFQPAHPRHGGGGAFYLRLRLKGKGS